MIFIQDDEGHSAVMHIGEPVSVGQDESGCWVYELPFEVEELD